jgi:hypothetical protein
LLLKSLASRLFDRSPEQDLFVWFMLNKDGYRVKPAITTIRFISCSQANRNLRGALFTSARATLLHFAWTQNKPPAKPLYTYQGDYPGADQTDELTISQIPNLGNRLAKRTLRVLGG